MQTVQELVSLAERLRAGGDLDGAARHFGRAISLDKDRSPEPTTGLAHVALLLERHHDAAVLLDRVLAVHPRSSRALTLRGIAAAAQSQLPAAASWFRRALQVDPAYGPAMINLGTALAALEDWPGALDILRQARAAGATPLPVLLLATAAAHCDQVPEAVSVLLERLQSSPNDVDATVMLANLLCGAGRTTLASELIEAAALRLPNNQRLAAHLTVIKGRASAAKS